MDKKIIIFDRMFGIGVLLGLLYFTWSLTGCSLKMEFGYHGQTGRDDRMQTELVKEDGWKKQK